ncbi:MAG: DEAD/DEAH box helicase family protein [Candidatus Cloacimonetes bacterium]|nr:DEAD/DEAH box helicase family protein [Candidatus Cloacimonadota bacterium]
MSHVVIENPVINSPFKEPDKHFRFTDEGITNEVDSGRRTSQYFTPIARSQKEKGKQQILIDTEWTKDRIEENVFVNQIRDRVSRWRTGGYQGVTPVTRSLLDYWTKQDREKPLFFCQIEALETAIYIAEIAKRYNDQWIDNELIDVNNSSNPGLPRIAFKMATGAGKTVVMAMLIAWQALNKFANRSDSRFTDAFLIISPGITIRDRLRVLMPNDPQNYYRLRDIIPASDIDRLMQAKIVITNYHSFLPREKVKAAKLTKELLSQKGTSAFVETPDQVVRRVCRDLGNKKGIIVINDEAHHCYRRKPDDTLTGFDRDEKKEIKKWDKEARVWISGIEAVKAKMGVKTVYDLSATPFFLRGSGYSEGVLFPWVVSDFSLIDAIESGIVKVPRVPVSDNSMTGEQPTFRNLWYRIRDHLPKKGRGTESVGGKPHLPVELQAALHSLYGNYEKYYGDWENNAESREKGITPPVFIVVCNNTNVSKMVYDYIAGWEKQVEDKLIVQAGQLDIFRNDDGRGEWLQRPNTILIDSEQLESGEAMSNEFKKIAAVEIEEFKADYRIRFPGRDTDNISDEDLLREVMNTVGKTGKLGEHVKCVVSVSMLTEGWDANTVTHILGVRAFGTQLLCEQVVGRALRRMSYAPNEAGMFEPEYAEIYGVPFSFIPCSGSAKPVKPGPIPTRVRALEDRYECEITFPRVTGYRYDVAGERLSAQFTDDSTLILSTEDIPTITESLPIVGKGSIHTLDDLLRHRENEVAFRLAMNTMERYFRDDEGASKPWLFPQLLRITRRWMNECVRLKDNAFIQMLLLADYASQANDRIYRAIVCADSGEAVLKPILAPYDTIGSTRYVDFDTVRSVYATDPAKCHISHVVADTKSWEQKMAQTLEAMPEVVKYVKNHNLRFLIPYTINGEPRNYIPDFIACIDVGRDDLFNLIIEVSGEQRKEKLEKVATARTLWVPAVNNHGGFGRWGFVEIDDPWDAEHLIRATMQQLTQQEKP